MEDYGTGIVERTRLVRCCSWAGEPLEGMEADGRCYWPGQTAVADRTEREAAQWELADEEDASG